MGPSYKPGPSSFSGGAAGGGGVGGGSNYRPGNYYSGGGAKSGGPTSSSYINIVHGPASGGAKVRPGYSAYSAFPSKSGGSTYSGSNFGNGGYSSAYNDGKIANSYISSDIGGNSNGFAGHSSGYSGLTDASGAFSKGSGGYAAIPSYSSGESSDYPTSGYKKEYDFGAGDDLGSYSSGGPTYAAVGSQYGGGGVGGGSSAGSYSSGNISPSYSGGSPPNYSSSGSSRGSGAYSTTNVAGQAQYSGRIGHDYTPSRFKNGASSGKGLPRFGAGPTSGSGSGSGGGYSAASSSAESVVGFNGRSLKGSYNPSGSFGGSSAENDFYSGKFSDGAGVKVQSSYSGIVTLFITFTTNSILILFVVKDKKIIK